MIWYIKARCNKCACASLIGSDGVCHGCGSKPRDRILPTRDEVREEIRRAQDARYRARVQEMETADASAD